MKQRFTLFVDESGDSGIEVVRSDQQSRGASPYMTMGAALASNDSLEAIRSTLKRIAADVGKADLHCTNLKHFQKLFYIRELAAHKKRLFGVISFKRRSAAIRIRSTEITRDITTSAPNISSKESGGSWR